jgi:transcriptional regulator with XRE-family HTH domain
MTPTTADAMQRLGERLKLFRKRAGLSLREAAPLVGVSAMALSNWERGKVALTSTHLLAAAKAYGCKVSALMYVKPTVTLTMAHWHKEGRR